MYIGCMGKCSYTWEEWNIEKGEPVTKHCRKETWKSSREFCIFHDPSPEKDVDLFKKMIEEQFEAETVVYDFVGYYFPEKWDFSANKKLEINANFMGATFQGAAYFRGATFQDANFRGATFQGTAYFSGVTFQGADFWRATFQDADFMGATFQGAAYFRGATFQGVVYFSGATFQGVAYFSEANFQDANFWRANFQDANFNGTTFRDADFEIATFRDANFWKATFRDANFWKATFQRKAELTLRSNKKLNLRYSEFLFRGYVTAELTEVLLHRSFIKNTAFVDCIWPEDYIIYEEEHMNDEETNLSFSELETIYRDLKQNMQDHGDYAIAGKFYYREMEMRRKGTSLKKISRWWLEFYQFLAGYGEKPYLHESTLNTIH